MAWDARGRLWVAENYTYAESGKKFDLNLRDRILIFEDKDGDGRFDTRKVFTDELQMLTSIEIGHGGVWVMCPPQLRFIPDRNGDDVPDGAPEVVLDGLTGSPEMHHTFANGLRFGPDRWLYGRCGASSAGEVGVPGTPAEERIPLRGTIWRYHPRRKVVEVLSSGTTNPWGHDWNEHGELFFINTVNGHLWHEFAGAHFVRPHTIDPNPRAYELVDQHADHWHFDTANGWQKSRDGAANDLGGGHAHVGMMIYQGDNWPAEYQGRLFTLNLHGHRANQEILERRGSGYVGKHAPDFFIAADPWFRGQEISCGPDGGVFVLDWSDTGECHDYTGVHRTSGRIYKITYGDPKRGEFGDLARLKTSELVRLHTHRNEWFARQARLELAARAAFGFGARSALPLPVRNERGEGREEGYPTADAPADLPARRPSSPQPSPPLVGGEGVEAGARNSSRATANRELDTANKQLLELFEKQSDVVVKLRALWTLYAIGAADEPFLRAQLRHPNEHVRAWAVRLLTDTMPLDTVMSQRPGEKSTAGNSNSGKERGQTIPAATIRGLVGLAKNDGSGLVRLALASTLQRLPVSRRGDLAAALMARPEDANDHT